jgi:hypothetical protein
MSGLDALVPLIDNGGTRSGSDRRRERPLRRVRERRSTQNRRGGADRRRWPNEKRKSGRERRSSLAQAHREPSRG